MNTTRLQASHAINAKILTKPTALIIEDDLTQVPIWEYILQRVHRNFQYEWVHDAQSAEALLQDAESRARPYDLIISDIYLSSNITGIDFWQRYGDKYGHKMILVSSIAYPKLLRKIGPEVPTPMYVKKPLKLHECISAVHGLLSYA